MKCVMEEKLELSFYCRKLSDLNSQILFIATSDAGEAHLSIVYIVYQPLTDVNDATLWLV